MKSKHSFTLVELIIILGIVGTVATWGYKIAKKLGWL